MERDDKGSSLARKSPLYISTQVDGTENDCVKSEEMEPECEEHELFLREEYATSSSNNILPYKINNHQQLNDFRIRTPNGLSHKRNIDSRYTYLIDENDTVEDADQSHNVNVDNFRQGSSAPSSNIIYQMPNYEQFAGNLAPTSSTSVLVSFVIIFVILAVTIVPKIIPRSTEPSEVQDDLYNDYDVFDDINDIKVTTNIVETVKTVKSTTDKLQDHQKPIHSDVRCKCICPPFPSSNDTHQSSSIQSSQRRLYVGNTTPNQCNCMNIVRSHFKTDTSMLLREFCVRCECKYQSRNTRTIRRNVVFFIAVLSGLALYMVIQYILKHFRITRRSLPRHLKWLHHQIANESY